MPKTISRRDYAAIFGPTAGDRVRLADTDLFVEIEKDYTTYGEELRFGGGKVVRDGMGQSQVTRAHGAVDLVIINALIVDHWGVVKADVGIRDGRIIKIGKAGNPDIQPNINIVVGASTEIISAEGLILTAGAINAHANFLSPQAVNQALAVGVTTMLGGGTGPTGGSRSAPVTPGSWNLKQMIKAADTLPINIGFAGKGSSSGADPISEQIRAGACLLTVHEDWGAHPSTIDNALTLADQYDIQVMLRSDTMNECGFVEDTAQAMKGRTIYALDVEGAGGGHAPDSLVLCGRPNVIPASGSSAIPYTESLDHEGEDIAERIHNLRSSSPEDVAFAQSCVRRETMSAADVLHDMGAISVIGSSCQAGGRAGEMILRTWRCADAMKHARGALADDGDADNNRVKRYMAKYTINPAIAHGISDHVGSIEEGKRADLVLWSPAFFGVKPEIVMVGGVVAFGASSSPNSVTFAGQPSFGRPMFGSTQKVLADTSVTFVSNASVMGSALQSDKQLIAVRNTRRVDKRSMIHNSALPSVEVDPETYEVRADGEIVSHPPSKITSLSCRYFLF